MFQPSYFKQKDQQHMLDFISNHSLATLVSLSSQGLVGNHIPMLVIEKEDKLYLQGHVARVNSMWHDCDTNTDVMAIFHGPDAYISPNWYPSKQQDGKAVPTWNYIAVHVAGPMTVFHDKSWLLQHLDNLSQFNEKPMAQPWKLSDALDDYIQKMLTAIVGIEIEIISLKGNTKMSQNHSLENRQGVIKGLTSIGKSDVASWVKSPNKSHD